MIADLKNIVNVGAASNALGSTLEWDEKALTACVCDGGYTGSDCSQRICPYGDDPMTLCETAEAEQVQKVSVKWYGELLDANAASDNGFLSAVLENDDMAFRFQSYADEVLYTKSIDGFFSGNNPVSNNAGRDAFASALEALPNFRVRDVTVTHTANTYADNDAAAATVAYEITFHHLSGSQNSFGRQNLLQCPHSRTYPDVTGGTTATTFGCGAEGCQPRFLQPRLVTILSGLLADNLGLTTTGNVFDFAAVGPWVLGTTAATNTFAHFTPDSVLTCPRGVFCARSQSSFQGSISIQIIYVDSALSYVYAKGSGTSGNAAGQGLFTDEDVVANGANTDGSSSAVLNTYTYMGKLADFPNYASDGSSKRVDISQIMPDTALVVKSTVLANRQVILAFTTPECVATTDVTVSSSKALENVDSENIECAGRGECDRSNGLCQCFEGYTGNNCGSQTILV